jgi:hypothetical protein
MSEKKKGGAKAPSKSPADKMIRAKNIKKK